MKKVKYTKELLESYVKDCYSFAELCRKLGLKPKGSNPKTVRKKMDEFNVDYSHFTGQAWNKNSKNPVYREKYIANLCEMSYNDSIISYMETLQYASFFCGQYN